MENGKQLNLFPIIVTSWAPDFLVGCLNHSKHDSRPLIAFLLVHGLNRKDNFSMHFRLISDFIRATLKSWIRIWGCDNCSRLIGVLYTFFFLVWILSGTSSFWTAPDGQNFGHLSRQLIVSYRKKTNLTGKNQQSKSLIVQIIKQLRVRHYQQI